MREDLFSTGIEQFNRGEFFEAHETWEAIWMKAPIPEKRFYQGLIQAAAAFHHLGKGNRKGLLRLLIAAGEKLREYPSPYMGVNLTDLIAHLARCEAIAQQLDDSGIQLFDRSAIPVIDLHLLKQWRQSLCL